MASKGYSHRIPPTWGQPRAMKYRASELVESGWGPRRCRGRILGTCARLCPARIICQAPPPTWARSRRLQGQHAARRTQMMPARHHLRACASTCRSGVWRRPVLCERAAGVRLRLRLRHRSCSTMWSFEARLQETPGHHFRDSRCASRSRERTMAFFFPSRFRMSPIPYPLRNITRKRTVRCAAFRLGVSPLFMSM